MRCATGRGACCARCWLRRDQFGRQYLDFTGGLRKLTLDASRFKEHPAVEQLRNQVVAELRNPYSPPYSQVAVDSSGNQGLADDLIIYAGASGILSVNNAEAILVETDVAICINQRALGRNVTDGCRLS